MERKDIKINRAQRAWYKYRKLIIMVACIFVVLIGIILITGRKSKPTVIENESTSADAIQPTTVVYEPVTEVYTEPVTEEVTEPVKEVRMASIEEYSSQEFYSDAVVLGDMFISGIKDYQYLADKKVFAETSWTIGKGTNSVSKMTGDTNKVIIQIGLNDLNMPKSAALVYEDYKELINKVRATLPNAQIYVVSVFPITSGFEGNSHCYFKASEIKSLNDLLAVTEGVKFIDIYSTLIDGTSYLNPEVTSNGYSIKNKYYPFILNEIARQAAE